MFLITQICASTHSARVFHSNKDYTCTRIRVKTSCNGRIGPRWTRLLSTNGLKKARTQAVCMSRYRSFKTPCHSQLKGNVQFCLFLPTSHTRPSSPMSTNVRCVASPTRGPWSLVRAWWSDETLMWSNINYTPGELTSLMKTYLVSKYSTIDTAVIRILCSNDLLSIFHASHPSLKLMGKLHKI